MTQQTDQDMILDGLRKRPSFASAAAIGHYFVLNGAPLRVALKGLDALASMPCQWTVAFFDQAIMKSSIVPVVRQNALTKLRWLLLNAVARGYRGIAKRDVLDMTRRVRRVLTVNRGMDSKSEQAIDDLCGHLGQAIEDGVLGKLPDF